MLDLFDSLTDERARVEKRVTVARQCLHVKLLIANIFSHINIFFPTSYLFLYQNILSFRIFLVRIFYTLIFFNPNIFVPTSSLCIRWLHCKLIDCSVQTFPSLMWDLFKVHSIDPDTWDTCSIVRIVQLCALYNCVLMPDLSVCGYQPNSLRYVRQIVFCFVFFLESLLLMWSRSA